MKRIMIILVLTTLSIECREQKIPTLLSATKHTSSKDKNHHILKGKIRLNGFQWETECDCETKAKEEEEKSKQRCNPSLLKIFKDKTGNGLEYSQTRDFMGKIKDYKWTKVSKSSFSCVDGRVTHGALSTPGGDAGEFLLALHTYQNYFGTKMKLDDEAVDRIFRRYLNSMKQKSFTMCTDDMAVEHIEKELTVSDFKFTKIEKNSEIFIFPIFLINF